MQNFLNNNKVSLAEAATAAGTTDIESAIYDMSMWDGIVFLTTFGTITSGAVTTMKAQQGEQSGGGDMADLAGTGITVADDDDGETFVLEVYRPRERYVRCVIDRGTQNAVVGEIYAVQYGHRGAHPITNTVADTLTAESHVSPAEGTA